MNAMEYHRNELELRLSRFDSECDRAINSIKNLRIHARNFLETMPCDRTELKNRFLWCTRQLDEFMYLVTDFNLSVSKFAEESDWPNTSDAPKDAVLPPVNGQSETNISKPQYNKIIDAQKVQVAQTHLAKPLAQIKHVPTEYSSQTKLLTNVKKKEPANWRERPQIQTKQNCSEHINVQTNQTGRASRRKGPQTSRVKSKEDLMQFSSVSCSSESFIENNAVKDATENNADEAVLNMPYKLVLTKNGPNEEVCAVPERWVVGSYLYWPRLLKKSEIESIRSNENSIPEKSWKKMKCRLKLSDICSFEEALRLEDLYSKFQDTEDDEEMHLSERQNKKKQYINALSKQLLDVNSEFDMDENTDHRMDSVNENNITQNKINSAVVTEKPDIVISQNVANSDEVNVQVLSTESQDNIQVTLNDAKGTDDILTISTSELLKLVQENNSLQTENKTLKEELLHSAEFRKETKKNFSIMQTQLDKIIELLQSESQASRSTPMVSNNDGLNITKEDSIFKIIIGNVKFPIETKEQLDHIEYKLLEKDVMTYLVKKFSETCGTSGIAKLCKIGLPLMKCLITDELLNQFTWKGIKGSTKMAFVQYVKIRELFYKVAHLADKSCSFNDSDSFIQNSAIKHSGQRMKRRILSTESKINVKKTKKEINIIENDTSKIDEEKSNYIEVNEENINNLNAEKLQMNDDDYRGLKNNKESTDDNCREVNKENIDISNAEKLQMFDDDCCGLKNIKENIDEHCRDVNNKNRDSSNTLKLQDSTMKKDAESDLVGLALPPQSKLDTESFSAFIASADAANLWLVTDMIGLSKLVNDMTEYYNKYELSTGDVAEFSCCAYYDHETKSYYRAIYIKTEGVAEVFLVDTGESRPLSGPLRPLASRFCNIPALAHCCHLADVDLADGGDLEEKQATFLSKHLWEEYTIELYNDTQDNDSPESQGVYVYLNNGTTLNELLARELASSKPEPEAHEISSNHAENEELQLDNRQSQGSKQDLVVDLDEQLKDELDYGPEYENPLEAVTGYSNRDEMDICKHYDGGPDRTCFKGARCKKRHVLQHPDGWTLDRVPVVASCRPAKLPVPGTSCKVKVTHVRDVGYFFVQFESKDETMTLAELVEEMTRSAANAKPLKILPALGELVSARFTDGRWYRARVTSCDDALGTADVLYIDYGNESSVKLTDLSPLEPRWLVLPVNAVRCRLAGVTVVTDKSVTEMFTDMVLDLALQARVIARSYDELTLELFDLEGYKVSDQLAVMADVPLQPYDVEDDSNRTSLHIPA